jgi:hypothetical protein
MSDETQPAKRGRPRKAAEDRQAKTVAVRFAPAGYAALEALLAYQTARLRAAGVEGADYTAAHLLRDLVIQRARELDLLPPSSRTARLEPPAPPPASAPTAAASALAARHAPAPSPSPALFAAHGRSYVDDGPPALAMGVWERMTLRLLGATAGPLTPAALAAQIGGSPPAWLAPTLAQLLGAGLIEGDARAGLSVTAAGRQALAQLASVG